MTARLAIVGAGMMGEALSRGVLGAGWSPADLVFADARADRLAELEASLGVSGVTDAAEAAGRADAVLFAVKPQDAETALGQLAGVVDQVVSIAAGLRTSVIEGHLDGASVVRAMPNTPARVGKGATALSTGSATADATRALADEIFTPLGPVVWLDEEQLDAVTALSGSGPAYVFYLAEALVEAGVQLGLDRQVAETLAFATIEGAGVMLTSLDTPPVELREQVTSAGGTTAAAVEVLDGRDVKAAFAQALEAAHRRSVELGS